MTNPGRPQIGIKVQCRYPIDVLAALDRLAAVEHITRAELLRRIATRHVRETT